MHRLYILLAVGHRAILRLKAGRRKEYECDSWRCFIPKSFTTLANVTAPPPFTYHVHGQGLIAELIHGIVAAFSPIVDAFQIDPKPCLPMPSRPDRIRYAEIGALLLLAWSMLIFEPYALRVRQIVMNRYEPERSRDRAAWLLQQIVRKRMSFVKLARRALRRRFHKDGAGQMVERVKCMELVRAKLNKYAERVV